MARKNINILLAAGLVALAANMAQAAQTTQYTMRVPLKGITAGAQTQQTGVGVGTLGSQSMTFGTVLPGTTSSPQTTTLQNTGTAPITLGTISTSGTNAGDFGATTNCGTSLAVGASCNINVTFSPTAVGAESATLNIPNSTASNLTVSLGGTGGDPYYSNVSLLMHMDGTVGSSAFTDQKGNVVSGAATISATSKYGSGSAYFNGATSLSVASSSGFGLGTGDFTIEFWVSSASNPTTNPIALSNWTSAWGSNTWTIHRSHSGVTDKWSFWSYNLNTGSAVLVSTSSSTSSSFQHVAVTRAGNTFRLFINGTLESSTTATNAIDAGTGTPLYLGNANGSNYMTGYIDDLRITKGVARYTANFTPPTMAAPNQ